LEKKADMAAHTTSSDDIKIESSSLSDAEIDDQIKKHQEKVEYEKKMEDLKAKQRERLRKEAEEKE